MGRAEDAEKHREGDPRRRGPGEPAHVEEDAPEQEARRRRSRPERGTCSAAPGESPDPGSARQTKARSWRYGVACWVATAASRNGLSLRERPLRHVGDERDERRRIRGHPPRVVDRSRPQCQQQARRQATRGHPHGRARGRRTGSPAHPASASATATRTACSSLAKAFDVAGHGARTLLRRVERLEKVRGGARSIRGSPTTDGGAVSVSAGVAAPCTTRSAGCDPDGVRVSSASVPAIRLDLSAFADALLTLRRLQRRAGAGLGLRGRRRPGCGDRTMRCPGPQSQEAGQRVTGRVQEKEEPDGLARDRCQAGADRAQDGHEDCQHDEIHGERRRRPAHRGGAGARDSAATSRSRRSTAMSGTPRQRTDEREAGIRVSAPRRPAAARPATTAAAAAEIATAMRSVHPSTRRVHSTVPSSPPLPTGAGAGQS